MLTDLQFAVRDFVREKMIADDDLTGSFKESSEVTDDAPLPDGYTIYEVRSATQEGSLPEDRTVIYIKVREAPSPITDLKDCIVEMYVGSPVDVEGVTPTSHGMLEQAAEKAWDESEHETIIADLTGHIENHLAAWTGAGFFAEGWQEGREGTSVFPVFAVKVGVKKRGL